MPEAPEVMLQVSPTQGEGVGELATLTRRLRLELLGLDVQTADLACLTDGADLPAGAKGAEGLAGWLSVRLGAETTRRVLGRVADWASRNDRMVEVRVGDDLLKLGRATREQQDKIIDAWLTAHSPRS
jgi:hypothetical protein